MVSNASEDLPEPLTPVTTVMRLIGIENEMFLRLLTRAPRTSIASWVMIGACKTRQRGIRWLSQTPHLNSKDGQSEGGGMRVNAIQDIGRVPIALHHRKHHHEGQSRA